MKPDDSKMLLMPDDVCKILNVTKYTLQMWRDQKMGPPFIRLTKRNIRYAKADLYRWLQNNKSGGR